MTGEDRHSDWIQELEGKKNNAYMEVVTGSNFRAVFPPSLPPPDFVDKLLARFGTSPSPEGRAALVNELSANNTAAGRASILRKIDTKQI